MKGKNPKGLVDDEAFEDTIVKYRERIFLVILKYVRNRDDARDLTQETFLRAYRSKDSFRGDSSPYTWIFKIAINLALNFKARGKDSSLQSIEDSPSLHVEDDPSVKIASKQLSGAIDRAVQFLPKRQRMTFVLRYYEEMPFAKVAENLDITEGAAKANYHQAISKLRDYLKPHYEGQES